MSAEEEKTQLREDLNEADSANADVDLDDSRAKFINHSANGGKGAMVVDSDDTAVVIAIPNKDVDSSSEVSFTGLGKDELEKYAVDPFWVRLRWILFILFWVAWIAMLVAAIVIIILAPRCPYRPDLKWYHKNAAYKVYTKSFKDSDGNGIGDIPGVTNKLDYFIKHLQVKSVLLSSVYPTDGIDGERGVMNHTMIDPILGTMDDFKALVKKAGKKGIKILLDLIPNQTSKKHPWFMKSVEKKDKFKDYYIWAGSDANNPPNNWQSVYGGPAWTFDNTRQQWYLHQFSSDHPDLNLDNPEVIKEIKAIMQFWLSMDVGGFNIMDAEYLVENSSFTDEKTPGGSCVERSQTCNQPGSLEVIQQFRAVIDEKFNKPGRERVIFASVSGLDLNQTVAYYGTSEKKGLDVVFNGAMMREVQQNCRADCIKTLIEDSLTEDTEKQWPGWMLGNEEIKRLASRVGANYLVGLFTVQTLLPGTSLIFYGDEIGMADGQNMGSTGFMKGSVSPMQWDSTKQAGFSTNMTTWMPVNQDYKTVNVKSELAHFKGYSALEAIADLVVLRTNESLQFGSVETHVTDGMLWFLREATGFPGYIVAINFNDVPITHSFYKKDGSIPEKVKVAFQSSNKDVGSTFNIKERAVFLEPHGSVVLKFM